MKLIAALGNPGKKYESTRHNIAWIFLEYLSFFQQLKWKRKFHGSYARLEEVVLLKPETFMNMSGSSIRVCMDFFKIDVNDLLVIHDELDLPFGVIAFKYGGGTAGHNGLESIIEHMGSEKFSRLRLGIGRPTTPLSITDFVLSRFLKEEYCVLETYLKEAAKAMEFYMDYGREKASEKFNKKKLIGELNVS